MRFAVLAAALCSLAACSIAPPPRCCPPDTTPAPRAANTLRERADEFQRLIDQKLRPHWPHGALVNLQFTNPELECVYQYNDPEDAAIWTGVYTAAQAFRYASTEGAEKEAALRSVRDAVNALHTLATAPGFKGGLARVVTPHKYLLGQQSYVYPTKDAKEWWIGNTSRDQYTGWFYGNAIAYRLVDDREIRHTIREDVRTMITAIRGWNYVLHDQDGNPNSGTAGKVHDQMRLAWHLIAASILDEPLYWEWYREQTKLLELGEAWLEDAFDETNRYYDYYSFNLGYLNAFNMVVLEPEPKLKRFYLDMLEDQLYRYVAGTQNVFFDYMTRAAGGQTAPDMLEQDRQALADFPGPPAMWRCVSPSQQPLDPKSVRLYRINRLLAPITKKIEAFPQALNPYPLHERCSVNFLWQQSPYKESCCCICDSPAGQCPQATYANSYCSEQPTESGFIVYPGADYLVAYWMGRHHGFLKSSD